jgi:hypothetical protein
MFLGLNLFLNPKSHQKNSLPLTMPYNILKPYGYSYVP